MAAVELVIGYAMWLRRNDFVAGFITVEPGCPNRTVLAWVDWWDVVTALAAGLLACSDAEGQVVRVAVSLAEGVPVDLGVAVNALGEVNIGLVAAAVPRATGCRAAAGVFDEVMGR